MRAIDSVAGRTLRATILAVGLCACGGGLSGAQAAVVEFNNTGGTNSTNGLHIYIEDTTHIQVRRLNNTGQVYSPSAVPPSTSLDNGVFLRANGKVYGPNHVVTTFAADAMYDTHTITGPVPANPSALGTQQLATQNLGITSGPSASIVWKYTNPYDFMTAEVTLTIPSGYSVSSANPVRYYHIFDTYLGGSDYGCGVKFIDSNNHLVVGTYPPKSGNKCLSSTGIPAGVSVVESFRERGGLPFSHYCAQGWSTFWLSGSPNCYVKQTAPLSDAIATTYMDTGIGVEYDFTAAGTYTFSYDFVIGSATVPPYDHLEIRHDGGGTLCPDTVTVLGCTSSTVPCPAGYYVNADLSGTLTPSAPTVTWTPATFSIAAGDLQTSVSMQATAAGTITFGATGLSAIPLNGVKCWNTTANTASCNYVVANTPCVAGFECLETSLAYNNLTASPTSRNPLYTKPTGTNFKFDVVALQSTGPVATGYTAAGNVTVELFDDSATPQKACASLSSPVASQSITFAASDLGRKTVPNNFNLAKAYRKLRCRVTDSNLTPAVQGCSSDDFSVRPQGFSVTSSNANADSTGVSATATPRVKAGATFSLIAAAGVPGYDGTPLVDATLLEWLNAPSGGRASPGTGTIWRALATPPTSPFQFPSAAVASPPSPATATDSVATGSDFTYDEVGYFRFKADGVYDDTFTADSGDRANGDCTDNFSTTPATTPLADVGKYGCKFGNVAATNYFGRFIPDHFTTTVTEGCPGIFSYSGEPFAVVTTAKNGADATTSNYDADAPAAVHVFSKDVTLTAWNGITQNPGPGALSNAAVGAADFKAGSAGTFPPSVSSPYYTFTNLQTMPTVVSLRATETSGDGVSSNGFAEGTTTIRSGCARLSNAYGSELMDLPVPFRVVYYKNGWLLNKDDVCTGDTTLAAGSPNPNDVSVTLSATPTTCVLDTGNPGRSNVGCTAAATPTSRQFKKGGAGGGAFAGDFNLSLQKTGSLGTVTVTGKVPTWLQRCTGGANPTGRASFGIYKSPLIYRKENY